MANLESNDIDDLFKRASDKYPLRTDSADWDKLAAAMEKDPSLIVPSSAAEGGDRRRRRRFLWLFLLLPLGGLVYYIGQMTGHHTARATSAAHVSSSQPATAPANGGSATSIQSDDVTTSDRSGSAVKGSAQGVKPVTGSAHQTLNPAGTDPSGSISGAPAPVGGGSVGSVAKNGGSARSVHHGVVSNKSAQQTNLSSGAVSGSMHPKHTALRNYEYPDPTNEAASTSDLTANGTRNGNNTRRTGTNMKGNKPEKIGVIDGNNNNEKDAAFSGLNFQRASTKNGVALNVTVKANNTTTAIKDSSSKKNIVKNNKKLSHFYAGLIVAPDLSTVKLQSVKGVGTTFGILLGYNINRKWAIETGAYFDHKKYYTDGEYFKRKDPNTNWTLLNVDGACNMWEIPINVRYNLSSGEKTKWFATAGLSTYLMTHENYVSEYALNGYSWPSTWSASNNSKYLFSIVNLSIGYEQKLGKIGNLRLEPYLRVPLSGIGSGSLPILSAGLNIGITRKLW